MHIDQGRAFREVLQSLIRIKDTEADVPMPENGRWLPAGEILGDGYSLAWRVLDAAQGWGVAQRRKRIFAVLDLDGQCAGKVLFESEGLSGYTPPGGEARQGAARSAEGGAGAAGERVSAAGFCREHSADSRGIGYEKERAPTLRAGVVPGVAIDFNPTDSRIRISEDGVCQTLCSRMGTGGNTLGAELGVTAASSVAITADELIDLQHSLKSGYRRKGLWIMNDATLKLLRKLKDGQGNFIWQLGLLAGQPDTLLNQKVLVSNYMPLPTAGNKAILYGDFSYYWLADREGRSIQRLNELFAQKDQVGFKVTQRVDGRLILREAVKCLQMKA